jgi:CheY-like chemotaxis protein
MERPGQILVVDDDPVIRTALQRLLRREEYAVTEAASAEEGLRVLTRQPVDLVITDLQMPGRDGLELLDDIKERRPEIPVVMMTAYGTMDIVVQALRQGISDFVTKPFRADELLQIIEREVARYRRSLPPGGEESLSLYLSSQVLDEADQLLATLRGDINARAVMLIESNGAVIAGKGAVERENIAALAALVSGDFAATSGIASLIGEGNTFRLNYHEGETYSVYSSQIAPGVFLLIIFGKQIKLGAVMYYARDVVLQLQELFQTVVEAAKAKAPPTRTPSTKPTPSAPQAPRTSPQPVEKPDGVEVTGTDVEEGLAESSEVYSFEEMVESGLLDSDFLSGFDDQFGSLWSEEGS